MEKIKAGVNAVVLFLASLFIITGPYAVIIASILSSIDFYLVGHSVIAGVAGFFIGGLLASIVMTVIVLILGWIGYYTNKGE